MKASRLFSGSNGGGRLLEFAEKEPVCVWANKGLGVLGGVIVDEASTGFEGFLERKANWEAFFFGNLVKTGSDGTGGINVAAEV
jgi:hypothetical protein